MGVLQAINGGLEATVLQGLRGTPLGADSDSHLAPKTFTDDRLQSGAICHGIDNFTLRMTNTKIEGNDNAKNPRTDITFQSFLSDGSQEFFQQYQQGGQFGYYSRPMFGSGVSVTGYPAPGYVQNRFLRKGKWAFSGSLTINPALATYTSGYQILMSLLLIPLASSPISQDMFTSQGTVLPKQFNVRPPLGKNFVGPGAPAFPAINDPLQTHGFQGQPMNCTLGETSYDVFIMLGGFGFWNWTQIFIPRGSPLGGGSNFFAVTAGLINILPTGFQLWDYRMNGQRVDDGVTPLN